MNKLAGTDVPEDFLRTLWAGRLLTILQTLVASQRKLSLRCNRHNQIPVHPPDIPKTAITTPFGLFEFPFMTYGLRNAAQTFQRFVDEALRGLDFCYGYLDDILIFSESEVQHLEHLRQLFQRLTDYGVLINAAKCEFGQSTITFLGHDVTAAGIRPLDDKVKAITDFPQPRNVKELRRFLGMYNFYRRFIPGASDIQGPLNAALAGPKKRGQREIIMTQEMLTTFTDCKSAISRATMLAHPDPNAELAIYTDASDTAMGAVLQQKSGTDWQPLAFFSRRLEVYVTISTGAYSTLYKTYYKSLHKRINVSPTLLFIFTSLR